MGENTTFDCPGCGIEVRQCLSDTEEFICGRCRKRFGVLYDPDSKTAAFVVPPGPQASEPLGLPRGSVRAMVALALSGSVWGLMLAGKPVPQHLLGLLLAVLSYYFGSRRAPQSTGIYATTAAKPPLYVPAGGIRTILAAGFALSFVVVLARGQLDGYLEFVAIVAGLVVGTAIAKAAAQLPPASLKLANNVKAVAVLVAAVTLATIMLGGLDMPRLELACATVVSFYFGSRS